MRKWIQFNLEHPKLVLILIIIISILAFYGIQNLYFDSSTEALMPKDSIEYKMGERAKQVFVDSKTFMLTSIEPADGHKLFSYEVFSHINDMIKEIEEFKDFNLDLEDQRLNSIIALGNVSIDNGNNRETKIPDTTVNQKDAVIESDLDAELLDDEPKKSSVKTVEIESDLDAELLGDKESQSSGKKDPVESDLDAELLGEGNTISEESEKQKIDPAGDMWDLDKPFSNDYSVVPIRDRKKYNYNNYEPIKLKELKDSLDHVAKMQLDTILDSCRLLYLKDDTLLNVKEFKAILEKWEEMYLYKSMEIVKTLMNPISGEDIKGTKDELKPVDFIKENEDGERIIPKTEKEFSEYKQTILANPAFHSTLYSMDEKGKFRALAVSLSFKTQKDHGPINIYIRDLMEKYNRGPVIITVVGSPVFLEYIKEYMHDDLFTFLPMIFLVIIITFFLNFRLFRGVLLPTICLFLGSLWTMGLMGIFGIPITMIVNMLPSLLVAVASSYSIHIFNQYLHDQDMLYSKEKKKGLLISMNHISITVLLAAFTTFAGFLTLTVNQISSLRDFGIFAAIGTLLSMAISIMLIPSALMLMKLLPRKKKSDDKHIEVHANPLVEKIVTKFNHLSLNRPLYVVIVSSIIFIISVIGLSMIKVETGPMFNFKEDSWIYKAEMRIGDLFNGTMFVNMIIDSGEKDGVKNPEFLKMIEEIREWLVTPEGKEKYHHLNTLSFGDIIKRMHMAMNEDNRSFYKIPDEESVIRDYLEIFSGEDKDSDGRIDSMEQFIDPDYRYVCLLLQTGNYRGNLFTSDINNRGQKRIIDYLAAHPMASKYTAYVVGESVNFSVISELVVEGQIISVVLTLIIVSLIVFVLFHNWYAGLVALIPISFSITVVYGAMGYFDIPLDVAKALLAAIAIGIGVDDTIHMLKTLRHNLLKGHSLKKAMILTHGEAGVAIVYTSLALVLGFSVLLFSNFVPIMYLGILVTSTMVATTLSALILLPATIILFKLPIDKELKWRIFKYINIAVFSESEKN